MARLIIRVLKKIRSKFLSADKGKRDLIRIGANSSIHDVIFTSRNSVGKNCFLYKCSIGEFSYIAENSSIMNTEIGKFCSIARNVGIGLGKHPTHTFVSTHPAFFSPYKQCGDTFATQSYFNEMGKTKIGNDVWIGANVVIMDDVTIGDGVIIGAGAIVTKDVPSYAIVVGSPAKVVKYRFTEDQINFLLKFRWWDKDISWLTANFKDFHNIDEFILKYGKN